MSGRPENTFFGFITHNILFAIHIEKVDTNLPLGQHELGVLVKDKMELIIHKLVAFLFMRAIYYIHVILYEIS